MQFRVLGPLEVRTDAGPVVPRGARSRAQLTALLLSPGQLVPAHRLARALWADTSPRMSTTWFTPDQQDWDMSRIHAVYVPILPIMGSVLASGPALISRPRPVGHSARERRAKPASRDHVDHMCAGSAAETHHVDLIMQQARSGTRRPPGRGASTSG